MVADFEIGFSRYGNLSQVALEGCGVGDAALGVEPYLRAVGEGEGKLAAARCANRHLTVVVSAAEAAHGLGVGLEVAAEVDALAVIEIDEGFGGPVGYHLCGLDDGDGPLVVVVVADEIGGTDDDEDGSGGGEPAQEAEAVGILGGGEDMVLGGCEGLGLGLGEARLHGFVGGKAVELPHVDELLTGVLEQSVVELAVAPVGGEPVVEHLLLLSGELVEEAADNQAGDVVFIHFLFCFYTPLTQIDFKSTLEKEVFFRKK